MKNFALSITVILAALAITGCKWKPGQGSGGGNCPPEACSSIKMASLSENFSHRYQLNVDASTKLAEVYVAAEAGDFSTLEALGFSQRDLTAIADGKNPSVSSLVNVADYLQISLGEAHTLIQKLKADLQ